MSQLFVQVLVSVVTTAGVLGAGWFTLRGNVSTSKIEAEAAPYDQLASRVTDLEKQVHLLLEERWIDRAYMKRLIVDWPHGRALPSPLPGWLENMNRSPSENTD